VNISLANTFENYHTYEIDWTPDTITWKVDGQVGRTKNRADTWNATSNQWDFPQTPARVQLSLWPGGLPSNGQGTIDWAGGLVDWQSPDMTNGYYYATFQSVTISCYNGTNGLGTNTGVSYTYNNIAGTNNTVVDGNNPTVLKSLLGTGTNMSIGEPSSSASGSSPSSTVQTIPGLVGAGPGTDSHSGDGSSSSSASPGSGSSPTQSAGGSASSSSTGGSSSGGSSSGGFNQGSGSSGSASNKSGAEKLGAQERVLKGSMFAVIVAVVGMMTL
jgi:beta-glucanase (GH16 family)